MIPLIGQSIDQTNLAAAARIHEPAIQAGYHRDQLEARLRSLQPLTVEEAMRVTHADTRAWILTSNRGEFFVDRREQSDVGGVLVGGEIGRGAQLGAAERHNSADQDARKWPARGAV